jgi:choline-glycine betaine transporter
VVALAQGLGTYRFGLPMTFRASFYPLLGEYTWGFWGDIIDSFTIVTTVGGICTSLGLGAFQITSGMQRLGWLDADLTEDEATKAQSCTVWVITLIATVSVISGINIGIKVRKSLRPSQICFRVQSPTFCDFSCFLFAVLVIGWVLPRSDAYVSVPCS